MSVRFYDLIYIIDCECNSNIMPLKDKLDTRSVSQRRADRERFRKNKIEAYSEILNKVITRKLKDFYEKENYLNKIWIMFGINRLPEDYKDLVRIAKFFELYDLIKSIHRYKKKEVNKDLFLRALKVLKSLES